MRIRAILVLVRHVPNGVQICMRQLRSLEYPSCLVGTKDVGTCVDLQEPESILIDLLWRNTEWRRCGACMLHTHKTRREQHVDVGTPLRHKLHYTENPVSDRLLLAWAKERRPTQSTLNVHVCDQSYLLRFGSGFGFPVQMFRQEDVHTIDISSEKGAQ